MLTVTFAGPHFQQAVSLLRPENGHEAGLLMLFGIAEIATDPWTAASTRKYVSHEIIPLQRQDIVSSSPHHFTWRKSTFIKLLRRAKTEGLAVGFVHSHRGDTTAYFSKYDNENDFAISELAKNCTKTAGNLLSIVIDDCGKVAARTCSLDEAHHNFEKIVVFDEPRWRIVSNNCRAINTGAFEKQSLAFGDGFLDALAQLNIRSRP